MSREEIMEEAKKHEYDWGVDVDRFDVPYIFIQGAEWMQKTMIKKACKWILHNMHKYVKWHPTEPLTVCVNNEDMANEFKQAMEE